MSEGPPKTPEIFSAYKEGDVVQITHRDGPSAREFITTKYLEDVVYEVTGVKPHPDGTTNIIMIRERGTDKPSFGVLPYVIEPYKPN